MILQQTEYVARNFSSSGSMGIVWASHKDLVIANVFFIISVLFHRTAGNFPISYTESILVLNPIQYIVQI